MPNLVAVTGAGGFVGQALVRRLSADGVRVRVLTRGGGATAWDDSVEVHRADLLSSDPAALARFAAGADVLYHCAAELSDPGSMHSVNVVGTHNLLAASNGRVGRWVQLSSVGVYGGSREGTITEETIPEPGNMYERTKLEADRAVIETCDRQGTAWAILRPAIVFGSTMPSGSVRALLRAIASGRFFFIGRPGATLPYVHVHDVAYALALCGSAASAVKQVFNVADPCTIESFVAEAARLLKCEMPTLRLPEFPIRCAARLLGSLPGFPLTLSRVDALSRRVRYPDDRLRERTGFRPIVGWRSGLADLVAAMTAAGEVRNGAKGKV
jgi:nucleoside-diphosphate-sugar epimerase